MNNLIAYKLSWILLSKQPTVVLCPVAFVPCSRESPAQNLSQARYISAAIFTLRDFVQHAERRTNYLRVITCWSVSAKVLVTWDGGWAGKSCYIDITLLGGRGKEERSGGGEEGRRKGGGEREREEGRDRKQWEEVIIHRKITPNITWSSYNHVAHTVWF